MKTPEQGLVYMFPGQGSQHAGMGRGLFEEFAPLVERANQLLGYSLEDLCLQDPQGNLAKTQFTQPALYTVGVLSYLKALQTAPRTPDYFLGHSLGEYCALFAAGAFDFEAGLAIVMRRGSLMSQVVGGGMAAVIGLESAEIERVFHQTGLHDIQIASYNTPSQVVISGDHKQIEQASAALLANGAKAYVPLKVSGPFHSTLMQAVGISFGSFLRTLNFARLSTPVIANVTARPYTNDSVVELLSKQIAGPVRWQQSIVFLLEQGELTFEEIGPGKVLSTMVREIRKGYVSPPRQASEVTQTQQSPIQAAAAQIRPNAAAFMAKLDQNQTLRDLVEGFDEDKLELIAVSEKQEKQLRSVTYGELQQHVKHLGTALLHMGVSKEECVALLSENRWEWATSYLAIGSIGAVVAPLDVFFSQQDLEQAFAASGAKMILTSKTFLHRVLELTAVAADATIAIICFDDDALLVDDAGAHRVTTFSSLLQAGAAQLQLGSQAYAQASVDPGDVLAKIHVNGTRFALLSHQGVVKNLYGTLATLSEGGTYLRAGEVLIASLPFHHTFPSMGGFLAPLGGYLHIVLLPRFSSRQFVKLAKEVRANYAVLVPFMVENIYTRLSREGESLPDIRFLFTGGAPIHRKYLDGMRELGCNVVQGYGLTECSPIVTVNTPTHNQHGSIGKPIVNVEVHIDAPDGSGNGELWVKGPSIMLGYTDSDARTGITIEDGWLHTGDIARRGDDGSLFITGRRRHIIVNKGGKNIYPEDIETAIRCDKYIADIRLIAKIDPVEGEVPAAIVLPNYQAIAELETECERTFSAADIHHLIEHKIHKATLDIAAYKLPRSIEILRVDQVIQDTAATRCFMFNDYYLSESQPTLPADQAMPVSTPHVASSAITLDASARSEAAKIRGYLMDKAAKYSELSRVQIEHLTFQEAGLDSITLLNLKFDIERELNESLPMRLMGENMTVTALAEFVSTSPSYRPLRDSLLRAIDSQSRLSSDQDGMQRLFSEFMEGPLDLADLDQEKLEPLFLMLMSKSASLDHGAQWNANNALG
jgi:malonyl CoA-acyl carrier protein transacylase